jgi:hypothetical protein
MFIISMYSSQYLHSINQDYVQLCRYLVLTFFGDLLFYSYIFVLVVLLQIVVIVLPSVKEICTYLNTHCVSVKSVPHKLKISYRGHVCNCRRKNRITYKPYIVIIVVPVSTAVYSVQKLP